MMPLYSACRFSAWVRLAADLPIVAAYSSHMTATFLVTPALSTRMLFSFLMPSEALRTASPRESELCRPKAAASLRRSSMSTASSAEKPRASRFLSEAAASATVIRPSLARSSAAACRSPKSWPVPSAREFRPTMALLYSFAASIAPRMASTMPAKAAVAAAATWACACLVLSAASSAARAASSEARLDSASAARMAVMRAVCASCSATTCSRAARVAASCALFAAVSRASAWLRAASVASCSSAL